MYGGTVAKDVHGFGGAVPIEEMLAVLEDAGGNRRRTGHLGEAEFDRPPAVARRLIAS
jgi:hypothetical protein